MPRLRRKSLVARAQVGLPEIGEKNVEREQEVAGVAVPEVEKTNEEAREVEKEISVEKMTEGGEEEAREAVVGEEERGHSHPWVESEEEKEDDEETPLVNIRDNLKKKKMGRKRKGGVARKSDMNPKKKKKKKITGDERESPAPTPVEEVPKKKKSEKKKSGKKKSEKKKKKSQKKKKRMGDDRVESPAPPPPVVENEEEEDNAEERESPATQRESPPASVSPPPSAPVFSNNQEEDLEDDWLPPPPPQAESMDANAEPTAEKPQGMYFPSSEYNKKIKIAAKCHIEEVLTTLNELEHPLTDDEWDWFRNHPQFKHVFHMPREKNHKAAGMWLLFVRTAKIEKKKEVWFVVNGVPIRYSLREHALISGFDCRNYPLGCDKLGSKSFVNKYFKEKVIRREDVREKLKQMVPRGRSQDRLKMAVLYFLSSVVVAPIKAGEKATGVDDLFQRVVSNLSLCESFPWGRYSFDRMLVSIARTMSHFDGFVQKENAVWPISGFCLPIELLPFEAIQAFKDKFTEANPSPDVSCPRMCKRKFKNCDMRGFPLSKLNDELGATKDIASIIPTEGDEEESLLGGITEEEDDDDAHDVVIVSWMERLGQGYTVSFEEMFKEDVQTRGEPENAENLENVVDEGIPHPNLMDLFKTFKDEMEEKVTTLAGRIDGRFDMLEERIKPLEEFVKTQVNAEEEAMDSEGNNETEADNAHQQATTTTEAGEPQEHVEPGEPSPQPRAEPAAPQTIPRCMTRSRAAALN